MTNRLQVSRIEKYIQKSQLGLWGHLNRMDDKRVWLGRRVGNEREEGQRKHGTIK